MVLLGSAGYAQREMETSRLMGPPVQMPPPMQMPPLATVVRGALEECKNELDRDPYLRSVTEAVPLPEGVMGLIRCTKSKKGDITVTIRLYKV